MFFQIKQYISFLKRAKTEYSVHSPFIFDLITKCFNIKNIEFENQNNLYRKILLQDSATISVTDFGAGSRVFTSNKRKVSEIAKTAGISKKNANLLSRLVHYFKMDEILEIGTSLGIATHSMAVGNPKAKITTLEGCPQTLQIAKESLNKFKINSITFVQGDFKETIKKQATKKYDLIYFDGNHQKDATILYFETFLESIHNESVFIFDDIHWSSGMQEAWEYIKNHKKVAVTIDTFNWGIVFFRKEQEKQHFKIKV